MKTLLTRNEVWKLLKLTRQKKNLFLKVDHVWAAAFAEVRRLSGDSLSVRV